MAVTDYTRSHVAPAGIFAGLFAKTAHAVAAWKAERDTRRALQALSDRELDDIGLCRGDIDEVVHSI